jgi:protocatechuate 3,4-dioxygenase beta subunit
MLENRIFSRRKLLGLAGAAGAVYVVGSGRDGKLLGVSHAAGEGTAMAADAQALACVLSPSKTEGPYFVDERLNRSDIRVDPSDGSVEAGVPLRLTINVYDVANDCAPVRGAAVDIWHANARGAYSDVSQNGTVGQKWLRGYQNTDANGSVQFLTIDPGWYSGRAIHIHFKIRLYDGSSETYAFTSQIFFDESVNTAVMQQSAYSGRGQADTRNSNDNVYGSDGSRLTASLTGSPSSGLVGVLNVGVTGLPSTGGAADTTAAAALVRTRFTRTAAGKRALALTLDVDETVSADARVLRGSRTIARRRYASLAAGTRTAIVAIGNAVPAGAARLQLTLTDANGNAKVIRRSLRIPRRGT